MATTAPKVKNLKLNFVRGSSGGQAIASWSVLSVKRNQVVNGKAKKNAVETCSGYTLTWYVVYYNAKTGKQITVKESESNLGRGEKGATYSVPENAKEVKVAIVPTSTTFTDSKKNEKPYWSGAAATKTVKCQGAIGLPPVPTLSIDKYTLTATVPNIVTTGYRNGKKYTLTKVEIQIVANNNKVFKSSVVQIITRTATLSTTVSPGNVYKARCRATGPGLEWSDWTDYSSDTDKVEEVIAPPSPVTSLKVVATSSTSVRLSWPESKNAKTYEINYVTDIEDFDRTAGTSTTVSVNSANIHGLEEGKIYYFRICAVRDNDKTAWFPANPWNKSTAISVILGTDPAAPTTFSTLTTCKAGEIVDLYWVHNTQDSSAQKDAQLELIFTASSISGSITEILTIPNTNYGNEDTENTNLYYRINTGNIHTGKDTSGRSFSIDLRSGAVIQWRVRTKGITNNYSPWSVSRKVEVFAPPWISLTVSDNLSDWLWNPFEFDKDTIYDCVREPIAKEDHEFTQLPICMEIQCGPSNQTPVGYNISIVANNTYTYTNVSGELITVAQGDSIYSIYFNSEEYTIIRKISASDATFEDGQTYTVNVTVTMNSGLTASESYEFTIDWEDISMAPNASIAVNDDGLYASIIPYCTAEFAELYLEDDEEEDTEVPELIEGVVLSVYRISNDGELVEIATNIANDRQISIVDPHPTLDWVCYRIVASNTRSGQIAYTDTMPIDVDQPGIVITWDEDWNDLTEEIDYGNDAVDPELDEPEHTGKILKLPFNVDISESNTPDVELIDYIGRKRSVSYYGTHLGETSTWSTEISRLDSDYQPTMELLRRLSKRTGDVYVREALNRSGYWANVKVSYDVNHTAVVVPVSLNITRVEGGM